MSLSRRETLIMTSLFLLPSFGLFAYERTKANEVRFEGLGPSTCTEAATKLERYYAWVRINGIDVPDNASKDELAKACDANVPASGRSLYAGKRRS